ncbi:MAG TPA: SigE family RNA polymerase sigma factor [Solirubrobacteraceae bacterium]|jgi:RNA polymerase sigma-70 factor (sigma-E family)|nr:SigE family RNA polymerase sigma factor [Solirubrobacteraceae bacterium]
MDFLRRDRTRAEFDRFVASNLDGLLRTAYLITSEVTEAEDLVQECLLRVARRWPKVRLMDRPDAYARRVLVNLALDGARRRARCWQELATLDGEPPQVRVDQDSHHDAIGTRAVTSELLDALRLLPARQRVVLVLRYFGDFSEAQVAETLGCSVGTVKSTTSRGLWRMREALEVVPSEGQVQTETLGTEKE